MKLKLKPGWTIVIILIAVIAALHILPAFFLSMAYVKHDLSTFGWWAIYLGGMKANGIFILGGGLCWLFWWALFEIIDKD